MCFRVDSFATGARILVAFLTRTLMQINASINKSQKNYPCEKYVAFSVINYEMNSNKAESKDSIDNYFWVVNFPLNAVGNAITNCKLGQVVEV